MEDAPSEKRQFKLLTPAEREYVDFSSEKLKEYNKNTVLQYNSRIRYRATNAIKEIAWLCDKLPEAELKKVFSNESVESTFKIQEKALTVSTYTLGEDYEADVVLNLFSWDEIPGNDCGRLKDFLKQKYNIDWVETSKIEKIDDGKTIRVSTEKNFLLLKLNDDKTKINLSIDDSRSDKFVAKIGNGQLNIYETVKVKRGKGLSAGNCWRLEEHMDKEIDALVFNTGERNILKKYIRCPGELIDLLNDLWKREHDILQLEYNNKLITAEEYSERQEALHNKLGELSEY